MMQPWIHFDGAVFGMGDSQAQAQTNLHITQAHIHNRDASLLADYEAVSAADPVTGAFLTGLASPMPVDCRQLYRQRRLGDVGAFAHKHQMRHLMLYGEAPGAGKSGRWMVLYRSDNTAFQALLTPGEYAVARRFAAGLSNKEIARELGVSPHTVRSQLSTAYGKLDVHDKAVLAQRLMSAAP